MGFLRRFNRIKREGIYSGFFQYSYRKGTSITYSFCPNPKGYELIGWNHIPFISLEKSVKDCRVVWNFNFLWFSIGHINLNYLKRKANRESIEKVIGGE